MKAGIFYESTTLGWEKFADVKFALVSVKFFIYNFSLKKLIFLSNIHFLMCVQVCKGSSVQGLFQAISVTG